MSSDLEKRALSIDPFEQVQLLQDNILGIANNLSRITKSLIPLLKHGGKYSCDGAKFLTQKICASDEFIAKLENILNSIETAISSISNLTSQIDTVKELSQNAKNKLKQVVPQVGGSRSSKSLNTKKQLEEFKKFCRLNYPFIVPKK